MTGALTFETLGEVDILPVTAQVYIKAPMPQDSTNATLSLLSGLKQLYNLPALPSGYQTTPVFTSNLADPNGIDLQAGTIDQCLWIALFAGTGDRAKRHRYRNWGSKRSTHLEHRLRAVASGNVAAHAGRRHVPRRR